VRFSLIAFIFLCARPLFGQLAPAPPEEAGADRYGEPVSAGCTSPHTYAGDAFEEALSGDGGGLEWTVGAHIRYRFMDEVNRLRPAGTNHSNYNQWRVAPHLNLGNDNFDVYVQAIDASIFGEDIPALPIDENRSDLLQYYGDIKLDGLGLNDTRLRVGRQFLKYGSEHLVSPLAWATTFRNFEGARLYRTTDDWKIDGFVTRPVNGAAGNSFRPNSLDNPDQSAWFSGVYATWKKAPKGVMDFYWLWLDEDEPTANRHNGNRHTIGVRYAGKTQQNERDETALTTFWDTEGAWQFGDDAFQSGGVNQNVSAGFVSVLAGVTLDSAPWKPTIKGIFWWGSGDSDPNDGDINTLTTLFPLGHAHWGLIDNFSGSNLLDYSLQASIQPADSITLLAAWHHFDKANKSDYIYNIAGAPLGVLNGSGRIGNELDLIATWKASEQTSIQLGYSWFWYGGAVNQTALARDDAHQFYTMASWTF